MSVLSSEVPSWNNYTEKVNWRRELDQEVAREGWDYFQPKEGDRGNQPLFAGSAVTLLHMVKRPNGRTAIIAAAGDKLYRFYALEDPRYAVDGYFEDQFDYIQYFYADWIEIGSGFSIGHRWEAISLNGYVILNNGVDLPVTYRLEDLTVKPIYELREQGISSVGTIAEINGFLMCADIEEFDADQATLVLDGSNPWGVVGDEVTKNRIRYRIIWCAQPGEPRNWASNGEGSATINTTLVTLTRPLSWAETGVEILIEGAGASGGNLSATVVTASGNQLVIDTPILTSVTNAFVTRNETPLAGRFDLQDDGSQILRMVPLKSRLIVYRNTSIFQAYYTGSVGNPFAFEKLYNGGKTLYYRYAISEVNGDYHVYAGASSFYRFDLTSRQPVELQTLEVCKNKFYDTATLEQESNIFALDNPLTKEIWFVQAGTVLAFDYFQNTVSEIDAGFTTAAFVEKPSSDIAVRATENWFVLGDGAGRVLKYGRTNEGYRYYLRLGVPYEATLESGLSAFSDEFADTDIRSFLPRYSTQSPELAMKVRLFRSFNPQEIPETVVIHDLPDPKTRNLIPVFFRGVYFKDRITATIESSDVRLISKTWEAAAVDSRAISNSTPNS